MAWEENSRICLHMQLIAILSRTGVVLARLVPSRGCSSLCCTNKVNGAFLRGWCTSGLLVHLRQVHPPKKIPTEANLRWDFHLYVFSDIYLTSTFLDVPSLILTTLMPF